jgi:hypothetical protein
LTIIGNLGRWRSLTLALIKRMDELGIHGATLSVDEKEWMI